MDSDTIDINLGLHPVTADTTLDLPLARVYEWEKNEPSKLYFTQPMGNGEIVEFTWGDAIDQVRRMASYLKSLDLPANSRIAIISKNCAHWIMSDLAIWMAGHISVPLYPTLTAETVQQIMDHSGAKVAFIGKLDDWDQMAAGVSSEIHCISYPLSPKTNFNSWDNIIQDNDPMSESPTRSHEEIATIIYTSGTTGMPKGVVHTFNSMAFAANKAALVYNIASDSRVLSYLPLSHVAERMVVEIVSIYQGTHVFFAESLDTFTQDLQRARPTLFFAVPRIWTKFYMGVLANMPEKKLNLFLKIPILSGIVKNKIKNTLGLSEADFCISGAAPISQYLLDWYKSIGIEILEVYGMTENMGYSHGTKKGELKVGYVGTANPGVEVRLGEGDEIQVKSGSTMSGYFREPEKTAETITDDGFLRTGDVGAVDGNGSLKITGRIKEIFKTSKGKYVAPAPIEGKILTDSSIEMVTVIGNALPQPMALLHLSEQALEVAKTDPDSLTKQFQTLLTTVNSEVAAHEKMRCFIIVKDTWAVENNFLTPTLKIKRNVVEAHYEDRFEGWYESGEKVIWE